MLILIESLYLQEVLKYKLVKYPLIFKTMSCFEMAYYRLLCSEEWESLLSLIVYAKHLIWKLKPPRSL